MNVKIWPRKTSETGGILMMPLRKNVPKPKQKSWKLTQCPSCGRECWEVPLPEDFDGKFQKSLCTECALKTATEMMKRGGK